MTLEETKQCEEGHGLHLKLGHVIRSTHTKYGRDLQGHSQACLPSTHFSEIAHSEFASLNQHPPPACHATGIKGRYELCVLHTHLKTPVASTRLFPLLQHLRPNPKLLCHSPRLFQPDLSYYYCRVNNILKGFKTEINKKRHPPTKKGNHQHQNPVISAEAQVWPIQLHATEEHMAFFQNTFNAFVHLPVQVTYPKSSRQRLNCFSASWLKKKDLQSGSSREWVERREDHYVISNTTKMPPTKNAVIRIVYSPTEGGRKVVSIKQH